MASPTVCLTVFVSQQRLLHEANYGFAGQQGHRHATNYGFVAQHWCAHEANYGFARLQSGPHVGNYGFAALQTRSWAGKVWSVGAAIGVLLLWWQSLQRFVQGLVVVKNCPGAGRRRSMVRKQDRPG